MVRCNAMASKALNRFFHCRYHGPLPKSESLAMGQSRETPPNSSRSLAPLTILSLAPDSSGLFARFCPLALFLSAHRSEGWLVGAVGIEPTTFGLKGRCSTTELRP
jgi:hypothetical protein